MKTFDIPTDIAHDHGTPTTVILADGTSTDENFRQDEAAWTRALFGTWFEDRELAYGQDYWLECCAAGRVRICFKDAGEAVWFRAETQRRRE